jgi:hypothetical protein
MSKPDKFERDFQLRCTRVFFGWCKVSDKGIPQVLEECGLSEQYRSRLTRLLKGEAAPPWDEFLLDRMIPVAARDLGVTPDDLRAHLEGRKSTNTELFRYLEVALRLLPRMDYARVLETKLNQHEPTARWSLSLVRFLPMSVAPLAFSVMHYKYLVRPLGDTGTRLVPKVRKLATERGIDFRLGRGIFNCRDSVVYVCVSDFLMMRDRVGPFVDLADDEYAKGLEQIRKDVILEHRVPFRFIDDMHRPLPGKIAGLLKNFDAVIAIEDKLVMAHHANTLVRSFVQRTDVPSPKNQRINATVNMLRSLDGFVEHDTTLQGTAEFLKTFAR